MLKFFQSIKSYVLAAIDLPPPVIVPQGISTVIGWAIYGLVYFGFAAANYPVVATEFGFTAGHAPLRGSDIHSGRCNSEKVYAAHSLGFRDIGMDRWIDCGMAVSIASYTVIADTTFLRRTRPIPWKVYGPDTNGRFGGLQGTGGLEATILDASWPWVGDV